MIAEPRKTGLIGEIRAAQYLRRKGYAIVAANYKTKTGEIDIIANDGEYTVFVEVKTRTSDEFGAPAEAIDAIKREKYYRVASEYLQRNKKMDTPCRFDVVEIENGQINHIIDAFSM